MSAVVLIGLASIDNKRKIFGTRYNGHRWELDENGKVDYFALECECHNGPRCARCDYQFCEHCTDPSEIPPCKDESEDDQSPDSNYDPTLWCNGCGARKSSQCHCGPIADND